MQKKKTITTLIIVIFLISCASSKMKMDNQVVELKPKQENIKSTLISTYQENKDLYDLNRSIIVMKISGISESEGYQLRVGMIYKDNFDWYLKDKSDKLFGFFDYKELIVLVFGDEGKYFFDKTDHIEAMNFLKENTPTQEKSTGIEKPPAIFEPVIWIYNYKFSEDEFLLEKKGTFYLLE